jgi:2-amino-4-hydroxy-6-hydroxymethyldihydropteridine diphosphokinase
MTLLGKVNWLKTLTKLTLKMTANKFQHYAFVGLGSNLSSEFGSPKDNVLEAIGRLKKMSAEPLLVSSLIESKPLDCPPGSPDFVNAVVALVPEDGASAVSFLRDLQQIENSMGRVRSGLKNEARVIDLDLLTYKEAVHQGEELTLPHPAMLNRSFVLEPLCSILGKDEFDSYKKWVKNRE